MRILVLLEQRNKQLEYLVESELFCIFAAYYK